MIQNLILSIGLSFAIGLNGAKDNHDNFINNDIPNNVIYDDVNYEIHLSNNEVDYIFENLYETNIMQSVAAIYDGSTFEFNENTYEGDYQYNTIDNDHYLGFIIDAELYNSNNSTNYLDFTYYYYDGDDYIYPLSDYDDVMILKTSQNNYEVVKDAVELDITANTTQTSMGNSIINAIKSGLGLIGDLASQFLLGFSTLFWNNTNNTLTPFGTFALVMLGVAITMAVVSLVLNIIRGNTGA